jgi:phosphatidylserine decarboxylase
VQAKSFVYEVHTLLGQADPLSAGNCAWYQTIYLAPHNYHRVHAPCSGVVERLGVIPGDLWPVNVPFVERIPRLFTRNERLVFKIKQKEGGTVWVVMVGAFNVGRMTSPLAPFLVTNSDFGQSYPSPVWTEPNVPINVGDELGTFMLGSTVILVLDEEAIRSRGKDTQMVATVTKTTVQMGQSLVRGN